MSALAVGFIIGVLIFVLIHAWRSPEVAICEHCPHTIQRSSKEEGRWFHTDTGLQTCFDHDPDSPIATPDPRFFTI